MFGYKTLFTYTIKNIVLTIGIIFSVVICYQSVLAEGTGEAVKGNETC
jgi:hypothetical protein